MNDQWTIEPNRRLVKPEPILLADDAEDNILAIFYAFKQVDIPNPLFVVYDGQHAIDYLAGTAPFDDRRKHPLPCLILVSTDLTQRSGLDVLQWIRLESGELKNLPVILLSDSINKQELRQALHLGANDFILKTLDFEEKIEWAKEVKKIVSPCAE
jgi:CheY-like chemotaxis protein